MRSSCRVDALLCVQKTALGVTVAARRTARRNEPEGASRSRRKTDGHFSRQPQRGRAHWTALFPEKRSWKAYNASSECCERSEATGMSGRDRPALDPRDSRCTLPLGRSAQVSRTSDEALGRALERFRAGSTRGLEDVKVRNRSRAQPSSMKRHLGRRAVACAQAQGIRELTWRVYRPSADDEPA